MRITFFARKAIQAVAAQIPKSMTAEDAIRKLLTPPTGPSLKSWQEMHRRFNTPKYQIWRKELAEEASCPDKKEKIDREQAEISRALGETLEEAKRNEQHSIY